MGSIGSTNAMGMIPVLTSEAGSSMTTANWQETGAILASFQLTSLLMKPGFAFLMTLPDLAHYMGWSRKSVLDASLSKPDVNGFYTLRSSYDGNCIRFSHADLLDLIVQLKPTMVILSVKDALDLEDLPETILPFIPIGDLSEGFKTEREFGVYLFCNEGETSLEDSLQQLVPYRNRALFVAGDLTLPWMIRLKKEGIPFLSSDRPAKDAVSGHMYCNEGIISLQDASFATQFTLIDAQCECPTCSQCLTRAYLHHLLGHTPQLCQRFLVQHNTYYCQRILSHV